MVLKIPLLEGVEAHLAVTGIFAPVLYQRRSQSVPASALLRQCRALGLGMLFPTMSFTESRGRTPAAALSRQICRGADRTVLRGTACGPSPGRPVFPLQPSCPKQRPCLGPLVKWGSRLARPERGGFCRLLDADPPRLGPDV